jgi:hypothetical protein
MRGSNLTRAYFQEPIIFGGLVLRRTDAAHIATALEYGPRQMDRFVWAKPAVPEAPMQPAIAAHIMGLRTSGAMQ